LIAYLSGKLLEKNLKDVVLLVGGVGYKVYLPLSQFAKLGDIGEVANLRIHTLVKEDAIALYGFLDEQSLRLFEQLIQVSGIGPKLALAMLSGIESQALMSALRNGDHLSLTRIPGIGAKTAARLVLELKDRLSGIDFIAKSPTSSTLHDLRSALLNLGYKPQLIDQAIKSVETLASDGYPLDKLIKEALKRAG
jgi:Holliday junction DNA helicase RuvA